MGALALVAAMLTWVGFASSEGDRPVATVDRPAIVTAARATALDGIEDQPARVVIGVAAFTPPRDGAVQGLVKLLTSGDRTEQEIGRFGLFPNTEFRAADPSRAQRFSFALPKDVGRDRPVQIKVQLVPLRGDGKDARLEIGSAEIR